MAAISNHKPLSIALVPAHKEKSKKFPPSVEKQLFLLGEFLFGRLKADNGLSYSMVREKMLYAAWEKAVVHDPAHIQRFLMRDMAQVKAAKGGLYLEDSGILITYWNFVRKNPALHEVQEKEFADLHGMMVSTLRRWRGWKDKLEQSHVRTDDDELQELRVENVMEEFLQKISFLQLRQLLALQSVKEFKGFFIFDALQVLKCLTQFEAFDQIARNGIDCAISCATSVEQLSLLLYLKLRWEITAEGWFCKACYEHFGERLELTRCQRIFLNSLKPIPSAKKMSLGDYTSFWAKKIEQEAADYYTATNRTIQIEVIDDEKSSNSA